LTQRTVLQLVTRGEIIDLEHVTNIWQFQEWNSSEIPDNQIFKRHKQHHYMWTTSFQTKRPAETNKSMPTPKTFFTMHINTDPLTLPRHYYNRGKSAFVWM